MKNHIYDKDIYTKFGVQTTEVKVLRPAAGKTKDTLNLHCASFPAKFHSLTTNYVFRLILKQKRRIITKFADDCL